ncbi:M61 family metallopeptidase [Limnohabitans sp. Rim47]|uniref:M61 family metallopeptidase n=1 Tax=Limnohabitans sp. Rim47 TaxID=1100721 RepID=UPI000317B3B3|nr:M61 family metallopeptidase [Limnohabitans sp. Rim47]
MTAIHYSVEAADLHAHLFRVTLTITQPASQQTVSLPVWIPGSYLVREFAKNLQNLTAKQGRRTLALAQRDKCTWDIACKPGQPLVLSYEVCAFDNSVRTAWLDSQRGFFNGTSLCLRVHGQETQPHQLQLNPVKGQADWQAATGLNPIKTDKKGFGLYQAADYDELVDCPVEMGTFWSGHFVACGIPHRFVVAGALPSFDGTRLLADTQKICEVEIRFWHGAGKQAGSKAPHKNYLFMLNAVHDGYGGLEHRNSTALICNRADLPRQKNQPANQHTNEGYTTLLGLISHEYFHTWNVKQLRPDAFARYDYTQENHTQLLWFFEGFTSYYDDLLLRRAGLIDDATYLKLLGKTIAQVQQTPGRHVQTLAQASFDAWVKYYRQDENTPNATVSYYTKGSLVALCLDLALRKEGHTLDAVMRGLWKRCKAGPMREQDLLDELHARTKRSWQPEIQTWVHSTADLPLRDLLSGQGIEVSAEIATMAQRLGLRVSEAGGSVHIKGVLRGSAAEAAGMAAGDEWLGLDVGETPAARAQGGSWRLNKLDDLPALMGREHQLVALVSRDKRLLRLHLKVPAQASSWKLAMPAQRKAGQWPAV